MVRSSHGSHVTTHVRWLLLLSLAEIATMLTFASYSAALPLLRREWQLSAAQAGAIFAEQQIGQTAAVPVLSTLTDIAGVRMISLLLASGIVVFGLLLHSLPTASVLRCSCAPSPGWCHPRPHLRHLGMGVCLAWAGGAAWSGGRIDGG